MKSLEQQNLISGVVGTDPAETTESVAAGTDTPATNNAQSGLINESNPDQRPNDTENSGVNKPIAPETRDNFDELVEKVAHKMAERLIEAEERGFQRAIEALKTAAGPVARENSRPNFLADIRRDIWES